MIKTCARLWSDDAPDSLAQFEPDPEFSASRGADSSAINASQAPSSDHLSDAMPARFQVTGRRAPVTVSMISISCCALSDDQSGTETITAMSRPSGEIAGLLRCTSLLKSSSWKPCVRAPARPECEQARATQATRHASGLKLIVNPSASTATFALSSRYCPLQTSACS